MTETGNGSHGIDLFSPIRGGNVYEVTVQRLLQSITLGMLLPGDRLPPERELAATLAISRDTLREAISSLVDAGYLIARRGRYGGTFVTDLVPASTAAEGMGIAREAPTSQEIEDVLVMREVLEVGAARAAASRSLSKEERQALWETLQHVATAAEEDNYRRLDSRLHLAIAEITRSSTLLALVADNRSQVNAMLDSIPYLHPNIAHSNEQHERIVVAILAGDEAAAAETMREHVAGSAALLRGFLQ